MSGIGGRRQSSKSNLTFAVDQNHGAAFPTSGFKGKWVYLYRAIKRRVRASQHFRSFWGAWRTIAGYEAIHMIRKGLACWGAASANVGLLDHFILGLFVATS